MSDSLVSFPVVGFVPNAKFSFSQIRSNNLGGS